MTRQLGILWLASLSLLMVAACSASTTPRTEIVIVVDSDLASPSEIDKVSVSVMRTSDGAMMSEKNGSFANDDERPATVSLLYTGSEPLKAGELGPLKVTARVLKGTTTVISQVAEISFVKDKRMVLRMNLLRACLPSRVTCNSNQTCINGGCSDTDRDDELTEWRELDGGQLEVSDAAVPDASMSTDAGDAGRDAGADASSDAQVDSGPDATITDTDAGVEGDAGEDAGPRCISTPETCNGLDDDCNGVIDNGFDLTSVEHCGSCDNECPTVGLLNASMSCDEASPGNYECKLECAANTADCDGEISNGCETSLASPFDCGECDNMCGNSTPFCGFDGVGLACVGACGVLTQCVDGTSASCVDTDTDPLHCGGCSPCAAQSNATPSCTDGTCSYACFTGYASCTDSNNNNGCETNTRTDPAHCNTCNNTCADPPNASPRCVNGTCSFACDNGFSDCTLADGCETNTNGDPDNCGTCNNVCPTRPNATRTCNAGVCGFTCNAGQGNCDGNASNGCETNTTNNVNHCNACGNKCTGLGACCRASVCRSTLCL